jgi:hypothetical protein
VLPENKGLRAAANDLIQTDENGLGAVKARTLCSLFREQQTFPRPFPNFQSALTQKRGMCGLAQADKQFPQ